MVYGSLACEADGVHWKKSASAGDSRSDAFFLMNHVTVRRVALYQKPQHGEAADSTPETNAASSTEDTM